MYFISTEMVNKILYYTSGERQLAVSGKALDHTAIGQALSYERQLAVSGNALDHSAIGQALSDERQLAVSGNALDHMAVRTGPQ